MILLTVRDVDIILLYISAVDNAKKLKISSYILLPAINKMFQYHYA